VIGPEEQFGLPLRPRASPGGGWRRAEFGHWVSYIPADAALPPKGWKVHVATCVDNAEAVLATVSDYCI
jgi:hypothetical protein